MADIARFPLRCSRCRHAPHETLGFCPNVASDNDCECPGAPAEVSAPSLIPVPDVTCANCGAGVAWRTGVGRYVISHANGDDVCSRASVRLTDSGQAAANIAYREADEAFQAAHVSRPGQKGAP